MNTGELGKLYGDRHDHLPRSPCLQEPVTLQKPGSTWEHAVQVTLRSWPPDYGGLWCGAVKSGEISQLAVIGRGAAVHDRVAHCLQFRSIEW